MSEEIPEDVKYWAKELNYWLRSDVLQSCVGGDAWKLWRFLSGVPHNMLHWLPLELRTNLDKWMSDELEYVGEEGFLNFIQVSDGAPFQETGLGIHLQTILSEIDEANRGSRRGGSGGEEGLLTGPDSDRSEMAWTSQLDRATTALTEFMVHYGESVRGLQVNGQPLNEYIANANRYGQCNNAFVADVREAIGQPIGTIPLVAVFNYVRAAGIYDLSSDPVPEGAHANWLKALEKTRKEIKPAEKSRPVKSKRGNVGGNRFDALSVDEGLIEKNPKVRGGAQGRGGSKVRSTRPERGNFGGSRFGVLATDEQQKGAETRRKVQPQGKKKPGGGNPASEKF
ncbi:hypothetical protein [Streptomyces sp. NPDC059918]|uniref:hypothetical protein n=1 Tax=unclassified Streptomyces TaxID=2593676 RepID=UPI003647442B